MKAVASQERVPNAIRIIVMVSLNGDEDEEGTDASLSYKSLA